MGWGSADVGAELARTGRTLHDVSRADLSDHSPTDLLRIEWPLILIILL